MLAHEAATGKVAVLKTTCGISCNGHQPKVRPASPYLPCHQLWDSWDIWQQWTFQQA